MTVDSLSLLESLLAAARVRGADGADALLVESREISAARRLGKLDQLEQSESGVLSLRVLVGHRQAVASSADLGRNALEALVERCVQMARAASEDPFLRLADQDRLGGKPAALDLLDPAPPDAAWLGEQCRLAEEAALAKDGIRNSEGAQASYGESRIALAVDHAGGRFAQNYALSHFSVSASAVAGEGTGMERDYDFSAARHRADLKNAAEIGAEAASRALRRLNPRRVRTCEAPVVFDPRVGRSLLGALAGAINGGAVARGTSFLKEKMGQRVLARGVSVIDDPQRPRGLGSKPFDAEGVATRKRAVIEDGELRSWLLDLRTAAKLGLATTGHASRGTGSAPSPASTNFHLAPGDLSPEDLIGPIKSGFYVTDTFGMGINLVTGDYSQGAAGFWIEDGALAYPVSELTIAGRLEDMFATLTPASDLEFRYAVNAPTLRIERMTVAGT